jgi:hypothetical protein
MSLKTYVSTFTTMDYKKDICSKQKLPELIEFTLRVLGIPTQCPIVNETVYCFKNKKVMTLGEVTKKVFPLFEMKKEEATLRMEFEHDNGKSCIEAKSKVVKV